MQHLPGIDMSGCVCITALFLCSAMFTAWNSVCEWSEVTMLSYFYYTFLQIVSLLFSHYSWHFCVPLNSQPMEMHGLRQGLLCSTQNLYSTYRSGGVEFAWVTHKVVWYLRYEQIYGIWGQSEVITNESIVFHFCRRSTWRVMNWERLIVGMDTTHCASSSGFFWKTSAPFAKQLPFPSTCS
jgi:hypothetical protein